MSFKLNHSSLFCLALLTTALLASTATSGALAADNGGGTGNTSLAQALPATRPTPVSVILRDIAITKTSARTDWLCGTLVNESESFVDTVLARIVYCDSEGNTLAYEYKKLLDSAVFTYHVPLQPGYAREFKVPLKNAPNLYNETVVDIARVKSKGYDEYFVPLEPKLGAGVGWAYGSCGTNLELLIANFYAISLGVGNAAWFATEHWSDDASVYSSSTITLPVCYLPGTRLYIGDPASSIRGRIGFFYGPTHLYAKPYTTKYEWIMGYHPSLGFQWRIFENVSLDVDAEWVIPQEHSRDYTYTETHTGWDWHYWPNPPRSYTYTDNHTLHTDFKNYFSPSVGITVHFGDHGKIYDDIKTSRTIHVRQSEPSTQR